MSENVTPSCLLVDDFCFSVDLGRIDCLYQGRYYKKGILILIEASVFEIGYFFFVKLNNYFEIKRIRSQLELDKTLKEDIKLLGKILYLEQSI